MAIEDERFVRGVRVQADLGVDQGAVRSRHSATDELTDPFDVAFGDGAIDCVGLYERPPVMDRDLEPESGSFGMP